MPKQEKQTQEWGEMYRSTEYLVLKVICHLNGLYSWRSLLRIHFWCSLQTEHMLLPADRASAALVTWRHNFLVAPLSLCTALPVGTGQKGCSQRLDKISKWPQFLPLLCVYQTCSCSQWKKRRSRGCSYTWEKGTISPKDSGPLSLPPRSPGSSPAPHQLLCVCPGLSFPSHAPSFRRSSPALPSPLHAHHHICLMSSICYYQHSGIKQTQVLSGFLAE